MSPPKSYRVYCFDLARRLVTAEFITASSDEQAIAIVKEWAFSKCEIWEGRRLVAQLEAAPRMSGGPRSDDGALSAI
jgi:hypothetical protein